MTGLQREPLRAEWIDQLRRFQKELGNVAEFGWAAGMSTSETAPGPRSTASLGPTMRWAGR
jgi:hypothetical protein